MNDKPFKTSFSMSAVTSGAFVIIGGYFLAHGGSVLTLLGALLLFFSGGISAFVVANDWAEEKVSELTTVDQKDDTDSSTE